MTAQTVIAIFSLLIAALSLIYTAYREVSKKNHREGAEYTGLMVKLENIQTGVTEIKSDLRNLKHDVQEIRERLVKVEQSTSSAHRRIDSVEGRSR